MIKKRISFLFALAILLAACTPQTPATPTALPTATAAPTTVPTATTEPTATALPSPTPLPTATLAPMPDYANVIVETLVSELPIATGGIAVDADGNIYVADFGDTVGPPFGRTIYKITPNGEATEWVTAGLKGASGNTFGLDGFLYQSNFRLHSISRISPDGKVETFVDQGLKGPVGLVFDSLGNLFVANCRANRLQVITPEGMSQVFVNGGFNCPNGIAIDESDILYVVNYGDGKVLRVTPEGEVTLLATIPGDNNGHVAYNNGILYVVSRGGGQIYAVHPSTGEMKLVAGSGEKGAEDGAGAEATFSLPNGIAFSPDGTRFYVNVASPDAAKNYPSMLRVIILNP